MAPRAVIPPRRRLLLCAALLPLCSGSAGRQRSAPDRQLILAEQSLQPGDVVFRTGLSLESTVVLAAGDSAHYSHVGVVVNAATGLRVAHAMPPEGGSSGGVVLSTWREFAAAPDVVDAAGYRLNALAADESNRICNAARSMIGRPFNSGFVATPRDGSLYCTQFAIAALAAADPAVAGFVHATRLAWLPEPVLLPDALLAWPRLRPVKTT